VAVTVRRRKAKPKASGWSPRLAGVVLCAFFVLGVMTGFSAPGQRLALRVSRLMRSWAARVLSPTEPVRNAIAHLPHGISTIVGGIAHQGRPPARRPDLAAPLDAHRRSWSANAVALVERGGGFYVLSAAGSLTGPVSPSGEPDLPILSGAPVEDAEGSVLVQYAAILVRAEAGLSRSISEMRLQADGTASLFMDRVPIEIAFDPNQEALEIRRAAEVLRRWRGRERLVATLDMTTPGLAVLKLRKPLPLKRAGSASSRTFSRGTSTDRVAAVRIARRGP
jgi:hypothetical protein